MAKSMAHIDLYYSTRTLALKALGSLKNNTPSNLRRYKLSVKKIRDEYAIFYELR